MPADYYKVLKLNRYATAEEMTKSFKRLAIKWHPDNNPLNRKEAETRFKLITQAYDVLSDPRKRQIYDLDFDRGHDNGEAGGNQRKPEAVESKLLCSLEELYNGNRRKLRISRSVANDFGEPETVEETLKIDILPGWKKGTKVTFPEKGNKPHGISPADLVFVVDEKPHPVFKRDGNDLVVNHKVSLLEALTGKQIELATLDGRLLAIPVVHIIKPEYEVLIPDEGMPISKEPGMKGKLRIRFDVTFPCRLTAEQKSDLKRVLSGADM